MFEVRDGPLALDEVVAAVRGDGLGAVVTFSGAVRNATAGRVVLRLEYEAYVPMATQVLAKLGAEVAQRWPGTRIAVQHRVGVLAPGALAVVIAAAAPHRKEAFLACEHTLERLKAEAPIWKREVYADGSVWVGLGP